jgi:integrase
VGQVRRKATQEQATHEGEKVMIDTEVKVKESKRKDNDGLHKRRGIWHYKLKVGGRWREFSTRTSSYQEARKVRQKAAQAQQEGQLPTETAKWPFEKAAARWLASRANQVAAKTYKTETERLQSLLGSFRGRRLDDINSSDIQNYQIRRLAEVSSTTVNLDCAVLRMILRSAKLWARIQDDYKPLPKKKTGPGRALAPEEEQRLFNLAQRNPRWDAVYYAAVLAANTTARGCELKGLRLADVDLISRSLTIRRTSTKTDAGCRVIPLNENALWAVARLLERAQYLGASQLEHHVFPAAGFRHTQENRHVAGTGYDPTSPMRSWRTAWRSLTTAAGLQGLRFHDLRHHCITRLAEAGVPEQTLMAIAGHVSREMLEHYSHVRMQAKREAVAALDIVGQVSDREGIVAQVH